MPYTRLVAARFSRNRGIALGIVLTGTAMGATLVPALLTPVVAINGWRAGYFALATVVLAVSPVIALLLPREQIAGSRFAIKLPLGEMICHTGIQTASGCVLLGEQDQALVQFGTAPVVQPCAEQDAEKQQLYDRTHGECGFHRRRSGRGTQITTQIEATPRLSDQCKIAEHDNRGGKKSAEYSQAAMNVRPSGSDERCLGQKHQKECMASNTIANVLAAIGAGQGVGPLPVP